MSEAAESAPKSAPVVERRVVTQLLQFVLGGWLLLSLGMFHVAQSNFAILKPDSPALKRVDQAFASMPAADRALALKYCANQLNRQAFSSFDLAQLGLAGAALLLSLACGRRGKLVPALIGLAALLSLAFWAWFLPETIRLGEIIEFVPRDPVPAEQLENVKAFGRVHGANMGLEVLKTAAIALASLLTLRAPKLAVP